MYERLQGDEDDLTRPDPVLARTSAEFIACLRELKLWAGDPSFRELQRRSGVPASTLSDALNPKRARLPRLDVVRAFVGACGVSLADQARWVTAWRALRLEQAVAGESNSAHPSAATTRRDPRLADRDHVIARIDAVHREHRAGGRPSPLIFVTGPSAAATSAIALLWARRRSADFPDGRLYLDLRRAAAQGQTGLPLLLHQLGVPDDAIPATGESQAGLYRSISRERTILVILDNVADADHIRPLLPDGPACCTLVTSTAPLVTLSSRHKTVHVAIGRRDQAQHRLRAHPRPA